MKLYVTFLFILTFLTSQNLFSQSASDITTVKPGSFIIQNAEYKFPAQIYPEIRTDLQTELWARVFWPEFNQSNAVKFPIIYFLHGNHATCGSGKNPITNMSCEYTTTGQCSEGKEVILNHEGYNYIAENLASHGYIVVSINANRGVTCTNGPDSADIGANLVRGRLILKHLELWSNWNNGETSPSTLSHNPQEFLNHIDFTNVGLMGHSRGGEGIRAALAQYQDTNSIWATKIQGLKIQGLFEIGAVDGQTHRVLDADSTNWNQLLPACDGDVSDLSGSRPYNRMINKDPKNIFGEKSLNLVYGTNHNFFNTVWQNNDSSPGRCYLHQSIWTDTPWLNIIQPQVSSFLMNRFFLSHIGIQKNKNLTDFLDPKNELPLELKSITPVARDFSDSEFTGTSVNIDNFKTDTSVNNSAAPLRESHGAQLKMSRTLGYLNISWLDNSEDNYVFIRVPRDKQNFLKFESLSLRLSLGSCSEFYSIPLNFKIQLIDKKQNISETVQLKNYYLMNQNGTCAIAFFTPVRFPIKSFIKPDLEVDNIEFIKMIFDDNPKGKILISSIDLTHAKPFNFIPLSSIKPVSPFILIPNQSSFVSQDKALATIIFEQQSNTHTDLTFYSKNPFLPRNELLILHLGNKSYVNAYYPNPNHLNTVAFKIKKSDLNNQNLDSLLADNINATISYGPQIMSQKIWTTK